MRNVWIFVNKCMYLSMAKAAILPATFEKKNKKQKTKKRAIKNWPWHVFVEYL